MRYLILAVCLVLVVTACAAPLYRATRMGDTYDYAVKGEWLDTTLSPPVAHKVSGFGRVQFASVKGYTDSPMQQGHGYFTTWLRETEDEEYTIAQGYLAGNDKVEGQFVPLGDNPPVIQSAAGIAPGGPLFGIVDAFSIAFPSSVFARGLFPKVNNDTSRLVLSNPTAMVTPAGGFSTIRVQRNYPFATGTTLTITDYFVPHLGYDAVIELSVKGAWLQRWELIKYAFAEK